MDIRGKKLVLVGGAGLIGSHTVDRLVKEDVGEILIYDNLVRGTPREPAGSHEGSSRSRSIDVGRRHHADGHPATPR